jgi:CDP-diacylglycerol--glycerol-3-phosphate 3-phosphatidyltransferase
VPIWVPLVFVARGSFVDAIRGSRSATDGIAPFALTERAWAKWLVAGKFMRSFYAVMKAHAFCWLLLIKPLPDIAPGFWSEWGRPLQLIGAVFVWIAVILCIARGLPVIIEFLVNHSRREQAARSR